MPRKKNSADLLTGLLRMHEVREREKAEAEQEPTVKKLGFWRSLLTLGKSHLQERERKLSSSGTSSPDSATSSSPRSKNPESSPRHSSQHLQNPAQKNAARIPQKQLIKTENPLKGPVSSFTSQPQQIGSEEIHLDPPQNDGSTSLNPSSPGDWKDGSWLGIPWGHSSPGPLSPPQIPGSSWTQQFEGKPNQGSFLGSDGTESRPPAGDNSTSGPHFMDVIRPGRLPENPPSESSARNEPEFGNSGSYHQNSLNPGQGGESAKKDSDWFPYSEGGYEGGEPSSLNPEHPLAPDLYGKDEGAEEFYEDYQPGSQQSNTQSWSSEDPKEMETNNRGRIPPKYSQSDLFEDSESPIENPQPPRSDYEDCYEEQHSESKAWENRTPYEAETFSVGDGAYEDGAYEDGAYEEEVYEESALEDKTTEPRETHLGSVGERESDEFGPSSTSQNSTSRGLPSQEPSEKESHFAPQPSKRKRKVKKRKEKKRSRTETLKKISKKNFSQNPESVNGVNTEDPTLVSPAVPSIPTQDTPSPTSERKAAYPGEELVKLGQQITNAAHTVKQVTQVAVGDDVIKTYRKPLEVSLGTLITLFVMGGIAITLVVLGIQSGNDKEKTWSYDDSSTQASQSPLNTPGTGPFSTRLLALKNLNLPTILPKKNHRMLRVKNIQEASQVPELQTGPPEIVGPKPNKTPAKDQPKEKQPNPILEGRYYIQLQSWIDEDHKTYPQLASYLAELGYDNIYRFPMKNLTEREKPYYRISLGPYPTSQAANRANEDLRGRILNQPFGKLNNLADHFPKAYGSRDISRRQKVIPPKG